MNDLGFPGLVQTPQFQHRAVTSRDVDRVLADPRVLTQLPSGRHQDREVTVELIARYTVAWEHDGLDYWVTKTMDGTFAGIGGCSRKPGPAWNLHYRFRPEFHGREIARALAAEALRAADAVGPLPVVALMLDHNGASEAVAKKIGL